MIAPPGEALSLARAAVSEFLLDAAPQRPLLVAFAGLRGDAPVPHYEFVGLTRSMDVSTCFVRDLRQVWYRSGVRGLGGSLPEVAARLARVADGAGATRTVFVGASAGGFAAVVAGVLAGVDEVHAFSPQTDLRPLHRWAARDFRWSTPLLRRWWRGHAREPYDDLRAFLGGRRYECRIFLHVGRHDADERAVRRLAGLPGVRVVTHDVSGHAIARALRAEGTLEKIVTSALDPRGDHTP
ncbi:alpha/beta fold hydrolase [Nonomuraea sp. NPDC050783]|uniref:alpha/beta fold hydrolase n=1 Tax=Nonomuraea sp. NPDC050783 TaxID=3154634 RepID=UPI0034678952